MPRDPERTGASAPRKAQKPVPDAESGPTPDVNLNINGLKDDDALNRIGALINWSHDTSSEAGIIRAFDQLDELMKRNPAPHLASLAHYFRANACDARLKIAHYSPWAWEQPERQEQILELRRAINNAGFKKLHPINRCQVFTNLANSFSTVGRFIEAVELWDRCLSINPRFGMARGNRGYGLSCYANCLYDHGHAIVMRVAGYDGLRSARAKSAVYETDHGLAKAFFKAQEDRLATHIEIAKARRKFKLHNHSLGRSAAEKCYRSWCLKSRLFINPLNDLGSFEIAAHDVLTLPSVVRPLSEEGVPAIIGFFNQIKQEFVSARYMYYEGITSEGVHFSDRDVRLSNTLDYPAYSLAAEKTRLAFRLAYSLFDKIAYFLNDYLQLNINPTEVAFRSLWHVPQSRKDPKPKSLRPRFIEYQIGRY